MLRSLATFPLLTGFRGAAPVDLGALQELLLRVSAMVEAHHEIAELDLNPVIAGPGGAVAVDFPDQGAERTAAPPVAARPGNSQRPFAPSQRLSAQSRSASASIRSRRS